MIKNPQPVAIVRQAHGPQQVNNGPAPAEKSSRAREVGNPQNRLLEEQSGERLDLKTACATSEADSSLEAIPVWQGLSRSADNRLRAEEVEISWSLLPTWPDLWDRIASVKFVDGKGSMECEQSTHSHAISSLWRQHRKQQITSSLASTSIVSAPVITPAPGYDSTRSFRSPVAASVLAR